MRATLVAYVIQGAVAGTCQDLKKVYEEEKCCGNPETTIKFPYVNASSCPYSFGKLLCTDAGPQAPKDLTTATLNTAAHGTRNPQAPIFTHDQMNHMTVVNVHFHLGAEHKSDNYNDEQFTEDYDASNPVGGPYGVTDHPARPGFYGSGYSPSGRKDRDAVPAPCKGMKVGDTIEVHWVHSSAGVRQPDDGDYQLLEDGLGSAVNGRALRNPQVHVEAVVYQILPDGDAGITFTPVGSLRETHWPDEPSADEYIRYVGSSTGMSYTGNEEGPTQTCSPYLINWGVDLRLHKVSSTTMQEFCSLLLAEGLVKDVLVHGSRRILHNSYVTTKFARGLNEPQILTSLADVTQTTTQSPTTTA